MIILGVDPGLANTGWGLIEVSGSRFRCAGYGCIASDTSTSTPHRLKRIRDELSLLIALHSPSEAAFENIYFSTNVRTAMATGQARGAALVAMADGGLAVGEYGPREIKLAITGSGSADKKQIAYMVRAILALPSEPKPDHAADALAVAICHANSRRPSGTRAKRAGAGA